MSHVSELSYLSLEKNPKSNGRIAVKSAQYVHTLAG